MANKKFVRYSKQLMNNSGRRYKTPLGQAGYDNPRENIDPHIRTKAVTTKQIIGSSAVVTGMISGNHLVVGGTISGQRFYGDKVTSGLDPGHTHTVVGDNLGNHIATQTISGQNISMSGEISGSSFRGDGDNLDIPLNTVENPEASKVFNFGNNKSLTFTSVDRTPIADEGTFNFEASGNFTGDLVHIHQHTGNAGAGTVGLKIEGTDTDFCPLHISGAHTLSIDVNKTISGQTIVGANVTSGIDPGHTHTGGATKEIFVPVVLVFDSTNNAYTGLVDTWPISSLTSTNNNYFTFKVPDDFSALTSAEVMIIADASETVQWDMSSDIAAKGQVYNTHTGNVLNSTQVVTINEVEGLDISAVLTNIAAGDFVGMGFRSDTSNIRVFGLHIKYS